ncbi:MAG: nuclear transport factor 2 family protein, partial [Candidatus Acidiferrales bacterium]
MPPSSPATTPPGSPPRLSSPGSCCGAEGMEEKEELIDLSHAWDRAMVENDAEAIGRYMADDWVIIGSDGRVGDKAT